MPQKLLSKDLYILLLSIIEIFFENSVVIFLFLNQQYLKWTLNLKNHIYRMPVEENAWLQHYNDYSFFKLFRMKKDTFQKLLNILLANDQYNLLKVHYRGGNYPIKPEISLLIFLWYMATQAPLELIADRFHVAPVTVMRIVNKILYLVLRIKTKYIIWPRTDEEYFDVMNGFTKYPGVIGCIDGSHIDIKVVPKEQQESYIDRTLHHSINLMAICTAKKIFTYIFVGFPGSAHDERVFEASAFFKNIERNGPHIYFKNQDHHIIGDGAFTVRSWLMTPYKRPQGGNLNRIERNHNYKLSSDRVAIENTFGILKARWKRLQYVNTYSISKAIEIVTAACIVHNFCYFNLDYWDSIDLSDERVEPGEYNEREDTRYGKMKRDYIAQNLAF